MLTPGCCYLSARGSRCCHVNKIPDDTLERTPIHDSALSQRWSSKTGRHCDTAPVNKTFGFGKTGPGRSRLRSNVNGICPTPAADRPETAAPDKKVPLSFGLRKNVELASIKSVKPQITWNKSEIRCQQMYQDNFKTVMGNLSRQRTWVLQQAQQLLLDVGKELTFS